MRETIAQFGQCLPGVPRQALPGEAAAAPPPAAPLPFCSAAAAGLVVPATAAAAPRSASSAADSAPVPSCVKQNLRGS